MPAKRESKKERPGSLSIRSFLAVLLLVSGLNSAMAQESKAPEKITIGDSRYILHSVQRNETLYSISKQYDCTQEEVLAANKEITRVIKKGMVLKIPDHTYQKPPATKFEESNFIRHMVVSGDNYYQLKLKYGTDEEELLKFNPELKEGLKTGKTILVPRKAMTETISGEIPASKPATKEPVQQAVASVAKWKDQTMKIALYLPISAAVADSLKPSARSLSFLSFYQGSLLAVDRLAKAGLKAKIYVYDTEKMATSMDALVRNPEFLSFDLLIGPVYPENQKLVSELSAKNRIPLVSPLSPDDKFTKTNSCYFQVNPIRRMRIEATADYILKEFAKEKIIFLEATNGSSDTRLIQERILRRKSLHEASKSELTTYNLWEKGLEALEPQLHTDQPNILVMAEMNEVNVSIAMNRLTLLSKRFPLILIGIQEFTKMPSIEIENLHNVNLRFLSGSFVDYSQPAVITFVENFKSEFGTEPSLFAFQGYDQTTFFLQSWHKSGDLLHGLTPEGNSGLLHTSYHFEKVADFGGFANNNFTVVEYTKTFEQHSLGIVRHEN